MTLTEIFLGKQGARHKLTRIQSIVCTLCTIIVFAYFWAKSVNSKFYGIKAPRELELKRLCSGEKRNFRYTVLNNSNDDLELIEIKPSCTCISLDSNKSNLWKAGAELAVSGLADFGFVGKSVGVTVTVSAKNPRGRILDVSTIVHGKVDCTVEPSRPLHDFGNLNYNGKDQETTIDLFCKKSDWEWDEIISECESPAIKSGIERISTSAFRLKIDLNPIELPICTFRSTVMLRFRSNGVFLPHVVPIAIHAKVSGPIEATPSALMFGTVSVGDHATRVISLMAERYDIANLTIERKPSFVSAEIIADGHSKAHVLISFVSYPLGIITDRIVISDADKRVKLSIPLLGTLVESVVSAEYSAINSNAR